LAKVIGVGGVFFKAEDPDALGQWYKEWLGVEIDSSYGGVSFFHRDLPDTSYTIWSPFPKDTTYFEPSKNPYMINLIVDDLEGALKQVAEGGGEVVGSVEELEYGLFAWFTDPEGNKVELWQPSGK